MLRRLSIAIGLMAAVSTAPALAAGDAAAGLQALKDYNLIVLDHYTIGDEVEGRVLVGGDATGAATQFGIGSTTAGQGSTAGSSLPILTVGGKLDAGDIKIHNGTNGSAGTSIGTSTSVAIVGNSSHLIFNGGNPRSALIGGNLTGNIDIATGTTLSIGGKLIGDLGGNSGVARIGQNVTGNNNAGNNGATVQQNLGVGFNSADIGAITTTINTVKDDVTALASALSTLTTAGANPSFTSLVGTKLTLNGVAGTNGFALFNLNATDLKSLSELYYNFSSSTMPVIVNVFGTYTDVLNQANGVVLGFNSVTGDAYNQQVIWNFVDATKIDFTGNEFHGSVIAINGTVYNHTPIEGSVVAKNFVQGGEVHLGTYNRDLPTPPVLPPVPEPATWAMMIAGMGFVGASMRRQARGSLRTA